MTDLDDEKAVKIVEWLGCKKIKPVGYEDEYWDRGLIGALFSENYIPVGNESKWLLSDSGEVAMMDRLENSDLSSITFAYDKPIVCRILIGPLPVKHLFREEGKTRQEALINAVLQVIGDCQEDSPPPRKNKREPNRDPERELSMQVEECIVHYTAEFKKRFGKVPMVFNGRDSDSIRPVVKAHGMEATKALLSKWLNSEVDKRTREAGYPLSFFPYRVNGLLIEDEQGSDTSHLEGV